MKRRGALLMYWAVIAAMAAMPALASKHSRHSGHPKARSRGKVASRTHPGDRRKKLDFDGEYVETVNKQPLDSLLELSEAGRRRNVHLYHKRAGFEPETAETIQQMRYN